MLLFTHSKHSYYSGKKKKKTHLLHNSASCNFGEKRQAQVYVSKEGTVANYGLVTREDLEAGEVLFTIPRTALLSQHTSALSSLLEKEQASLESQSGWVPLLLTLLHESTSSDSRWRPYLSLWPHFSGLDHPMFWCAEERVRLLQGTGVPEAVDKDLANIQMEYSSIVLPFMKAHPDIFNPKKSLKMVATQRIPKGQEVFNTYGQMANWQLLHMYGFAEPYPGNTNDAADIQMLTLLKAALQGRKAAAERRLVSEQWAFLCRQEVVGEEGAFVMGWERVFTEEELYTALKVLTMSEEEFTVFKEQEDGMGAAGMDCLILSNATISSLKASWKKLLFDATQMTLKLYSSDLEEEERVLKDVRAYSKLSCREQFALQVRYGQKRILHQWLDWAR
ncbi:N-lysine methyltransferase SETD6 isoform X2 [Varanus komodoensis]|uniref:N-lysine methyltransferase SETD6 isoform X2 n=1 Tax=Varanus komodoensis TaxID=61221 RepID=UPI001CF7D13A|nr:N-lysine methyltransferase SETD6 isoform X2 [Varanus komodoensis]